MATQTVTPLPELGVVLRRRRADAPRPYRTRGYPYVPAIYVALATLLIVDLAYLTPTTSGAGYILVLTGVPVYLLWRRTARNAG